MTRVYNSKPIPLHATDEEEAIIRARADERVKTPEPRYSVRRFVVGGMTVMAAAAIVWPSIPRIYESTATLVLRPTNMEGQNDVSEASRQPLDESFIISDLDRLHSVNLAKEVIDIHHLAQDDEFRPKPGATEKAQALVMNFLDVALPQTWAHGFIAPSTDGLLDGDGIANAAAREETQLRENLWHRMVIDRDRQSYTVKVGFRSNDPEKATALTNTLVGAYLKAQVMRKVDDADAMNKLLSDRVDEAKRRAETSQREMEDFLNTSGLIDQGVQISLEAQLSTLSTELANARAQLIDFRTRTDTLTAMKAAGTLASAPEVLASPTIRQLNQSLTESMSRLAVMPTEARSISRQAEIERDRIVTSVRVEAENWAEREKRLTDEIQKIRQTMVDRRKASLRLDELRLRVDNDTQVLADALTRMKTRGPSTEALKPDAEVLSPATVPDKPVFPILPLYLAGAFGAALLAGAALNASAIRRTTLRLMQQS